MGKHAVINKKFKNFAAYWQKGGRVVTLFVILFMFWNYVAFFPF